VKAMVQFGRNAPGNPDQKRGVTANVKSSAKSRQYERFGETIRYLTLEEWQQFLDVIEDYRHKLMMRVIYELGCRVGEFVRIQVKHINFSRSTVFLPADNTKTKHARVSYLPRGLSNEVKSMLKQAHIFTTYYIYPIILV